MKPNSTSQRTHQGKTLFSITSTLLLLGGVCILYFWHGSVPVGTSVATASVMVMFILLLWPRRRHLAGLRHDVLKDPRFYLSTVTMIILALLGMLGIFVDHDGLGLSRLILGVLALVATSIRIERYSQDKLIEEIRLLSRNASAVRSFRSWHDPEIEELIKSARESIVIVDSYFMESEWLAPLIQTAIDRGAKKLKVSIYVLDPALGFGAQRLREQERRRGERTAKNYQSAFDEILRTAFHLIANHLLRFEEHGVTVTAHFYRTMPGRREIIIDDEEFIFGSFPIGESNPEFTCFHVPGRSLTLGDKSAVDGMRRQFNEIASRESKVVDVAMFLEHGTDLFASEVIAEGGQLRTESSRFADSQGRVDLGSPARPFFPAAASNPLTTNRKPDPVP